MGSLLSYQRRQQYVPFAFACHPYRHKLRQLPYLSRHAQSSRPERNSPQDCQSPHPSGYRCKQRTTSHRTYIPESKTNLISPTSRFTINCHGLYERFYSQVLRQPQTLYSYYFLILEYHWSGLHQDFSALYQRSISERPIGQSNKLAPDIIDSLYLEFMLLESQRSPRPVGCGTTNRYNPRRKSRKIFETCQSPEVVRASRDLGQTSPLVVLIICGRCRSPRGKQP